MKGFSEVVDTEFLSESSHLSSHTGLFWLVICILFRITIGRDWHCPCCKSKASEGLAGYTGLSKSGLPRALSPSDPRLNLFSL